MLEGRKGQKRRFVRLEIVLPVKYRPYTGNPIFQSKFDLGKTSDLSSGGMSLMVNKALSAGMKLDIELELDAQIRPYIVGKVLSGEDKVLDGISRRIDKISFVDVDQESQDMIMKFIFENQLKIVRKTKKMGSQ